MQSVPQCAGGQAGTHEQLKPAPPSLAQVETLQMLVGKLLSEILEPHQCNLPPFYSLTHRSPREQCGQEVEPPHQGSAVAGSESVHLAVP